MPLLLHDKIMQYLLDGDHAPTMAGRGRAMEELICYIFGEVPGISVSARDQKNIFRTEEIDIAFFNETNGGDLYFLPFLILVECKNWSAKVGSEEVSWFLTKLRNRGLSFGILIAANGIAGTSDGRTEAHSIIYNALSDQRRVIVFTRRELEALTHTDEIVGIIKQKLSDLVIEGKLY